MPEPSTPLVRCAGVATLIGEAYGLQLYLYATHDMFHGKRASTLERRGEDMSGVAVLRIAVEHADVTGS